MATSNPPDAAAAIREFRERLLALEHVLADPLTMAGLLYAALPPRTLARGMVAEAIAALKRERS